MGSSITPASTAFDPEAIRNMADSSEYYDNISQEFIRTTSDKLKLCLIEYRSGLRARADWITPMGILITILATLAVSDFKSFLGIAATTWSTAFFLLAIGFFCWLIASIVNAIKNWKKGNIDTLVKAIKIGSKSKDAT